MAGGERAGSALYSESHLFLDTTESLLVGHRVYVGNQPDDFALAGVAGEGERVCLMGLGYGGSVRPILSAAPDARIIAYEVDPNVAEACEALYRRYFPQVEFEVRTGDARQALGSGVRPFDTVVVDLYEDAGYPDFFFDRDFWRVVRGGVDARGCVLVNGWGLPEHLRPFDGSSPQRALADVLATVWGDLRYVPFRRNVTFICGGHREVAASRPHPGLQPLDRAIASLAVLRLAWARPLPDLQGAASGFPSSRAAINEEMAHRWPGMIEAVEAAARRSGVASANGPSAGHLLHDRKAGIAATCDLLERDAPEAAFVPIAAAARAIEGDPEVGWVGEWVIEEHDRLRELAPQWFVDTALWQALAMAAHPAAPQWPWTDDLTALAAELADEPVGRQGE